MATQCHHMGRVVWFDDKKGYGFIEDLKDRGHVFAHWTKIVGSQQPHRRYLVTGEFVRYQKEQVDVGEDGGEDSPRYRALDIRGAAIGHDALICDLGNCSFRAHRKMKTKEEEEEGPSKK